MGSNSPLVDECYHSSLDFCSLGIRGWDYLLREQFTLSCSLLQLCKNLRNLDIDCFRMGDIQEVIVLMMI